MDKSRDSGSPATDPRPLQMVRHHSQQILVRGFLDQAVRRVGHTLVAGWNSHS